MFSMPSIGEVVGRIRRLEESRGKAAEFLENLDIQSLDSEKVVENGFLRYVKPGSLDEVVAAGVDGGLLKKQFSGVDVVITRAVASFFKFGENGLEESFTVPKTLSMPDVQYIESPLDRRSFNVSSSLLRLQKEVGVASNSLGKNPDMLLLDGSIAPQYTERPEKGTESRKIYDDVMGRYAELYSKADSNEVLLAGVVEDSRSKRFCEVLAENKEVPERFVEVLETTRDTNMLEYLMDKGERTPVMVFSDGSGNSSLDDIGDISENLYSFYLKTASDATPVRIDFFAGENPEKTADKISELVLPMCGYSSTYGIPSVVVDADQRAKLSQEEMDMFESRLMSRLGPLPGIKSLRRNSRPF